MRRDCTNLGRSAPVYSENAATRAKADRRLNDRLFGIVASPSVTHEPHHAVGLFAKLPEEYEAKRIEHKKLSAGTPR